jgi:hypothetical protein
MIDRYLSGKLSEDDASLFEEHLLECPTCLEQVRWAEDFQEAVQSAAAQEQATQAQITAVQAGVLAWLVRRSQTQRRALLLAASLLIAAPPAWLLWRQDGLERELALAQAAAARSGQPIRAAESPSPMPARMPAAAPAAPTLTATLANAEELRHEREASASLREQIQRLSQPQGAAFVALGIVRGAPGEGQAIRVAGTSGLVLAVELPAGAEPAYRATLRGEADEILWRGSRLQPGMDETLTISFPPGFLSPGSYRLQLAALPRKGGAPQTPLELPFQILPAR